MRPAVTAHQHANAQAGEHARQGRSEQPRHHVDSGRAEGLTNRELAHPAVRGIAHHAEHADRRQQGGPKPEREQQGTLESLSRQRPPDELRRREVGAHRLFRIRCGECTAQHVPRGGGAPRTCGPRRTSSSQQDWVSAERGNSSVGVLAPAATEEASQSAGRVTARVCQACSLPALFAHEFKIARSTTGTHRPAVCQRDRPAPACHGGTVRAKRQRQPECSAVGRLQNARRLEAAPFRRHTVLEENRTLTRDWRGAGGDERGATSSGNHQHRTIHEPPAQLSNPHPALPVACLLLPPHFRTLVSACRLLSTFSAGCSIAASIRSSPRSSVATNRRVQPGDQASSRSPYAVPEGYPKVRTKVGAVSTSFSCRIASRMASPSEDAATTVPVYWASPSRVSSARSLYPQHSERGLAEPPEIPGRRAPPRYARHRPRPEPGPARATPAVANSALPGYQGGRSMTPLPRVPTPAVRGGRVHVSGADHALEHRHPGASPTRTLTNARPPNRLGR